MTQTSPHAAAPARLEGVDGWLLALCLMFVVFGPLITARLAADEYARLAPHFAESGGILAAVLASLALQLLSVGYGIHAGLRLWRIRPHAVATAKRALLLALAVEIVVAVLSQVADPSRTTSHHPLEQIMLHVAPGLVFFTVCFAYLNRSRRVAATYPPSASAGA